MHCDSFVVHQDNLACRLHINAELEVVLVETGCITVVQEGIAELLHAGEATLIFPYRLHSFAPGGAVKASVLMFPLSIAEEFYAEYRTKHYASFRFRPAPVLVDLMHYVLAQYRQTRDILAVKSLFFALMSAFQADYGGQPQEKYAGSGPVRRTMEYLYQHIDEPLSLEKTATALGFNRSVLSRLFADYTGLSFSKFVNNMRLEKARNLLVGSDWTVTEIAEACGFGCLRSFNRIFLAQMHCTPTEYRKRQRETV